MRKRFRDRNLSPHSGIGADAIVAAGSAVSRDVDDGELRMLRAEQPVRPGCADRFHDAMKKKKSDRKGG